MARVLFGIVYREVMGYPRPRSLSRTYFVNHGPTEVAIVLVHLGLDFPLSLLLPFLLWPRACAVGLHWILQEVHRHKVVNSLMLAVACHHGAGETGRVRKRIDRERELEPYRFPVYFLWTPMSPDLEPGAIQLARSAAL